MIEYPAPDRHSGVAAGIQTQLSRVQSGEVSALDKYVIATVQQRLRWVATKEEHREQMRRFLRAAANKRARLVIFPEMAGIMVVPPLLRDVGSALLRRADRGRRAKATFWQKTIGVMAGSAARLLKASFPASLAGTLKNNAGEVWEVYVATFSALAREFGMTIVAPAGYLPDPADGAIRNLAAVFGTGGELLGTQAKVLIGDRDEPFCKPGATWDIVHTEVGALGIILGNDVLYPEVGRLLAFQGAEALLALGAYRTLAAYNKHRSGILARMQDNQIYAASAYTVGNDPCGTAPGQLYLGRSAIFAPQELTPRFNGVLVEMGNQTSEGVLSAEWDFVALKDLWETGEMPLRREITGSQGGKMLATLYARLQNTPRLADSTPVEPAAAGQAERIPALQPLITLDELPVIASVTSRWPLHSTLNGDVPAQETVEWSEATDRCASGAELSFAADHEEETDEMDALTGSSDEKQ